MRYDAEGDAAEMGRAMEEWADYGFMVGLFDAKRRQVAHDFVPRASAFFAEYVAGLGVPSRLEPDEFQRRLEYGERVQDLLHASETAAIGRRYRLLYRGMYVRFAVQVAALLVTAGLGLGISEIGAIVFLVLCFLGMSAGSLLVGDRDDVLYGEALGAAAEPVRLPWRRTPVPAEA